jgi:hypothetical protein
MNHSGRDDSEWAWASYKSLRLATSANCPKTCEHNCASPNPSSLLSGLCDNAQVVFRLEGNVRAAFRGPALAPTPLDPIPVVGVSAAFNLPAEGIHLG